MRIMNPKARITYRFEPAGTGGAGRLVRIPEDGHGRPDGPDAPEELRFERDVIPWRSPFQDDTDALERLIRETDGQTIADESDSGRTPSAGADRSAAGTGRSRPATERRSETAAPDAGPRSTADDPDIDFWLDAEVDPLPGERLARAVDDMPSRGRRETAEDEDEAPIIRFAPRRRRSAPSWTRAVATVIGAVLTGGLFGWLVMSLLFWQAGSPDANTVAIQREDGPGRTVPSDGSPAADPAETGGSPDSSGEAAVGAVEVGLPAVRYHVLQYGVFSTEAGLEDALAQLRAAGYAAAGDTADGYRAYAGIAESRDTAEALAATMDGVELYIRPLDIPATERVVFAGRPEEAEAFILATNELTRIMGGLSAGLLASGGTDPIPEESWRDWETAYRSWSETAGLVSGEADGSDGQARLSEAIRRAADAFAAYRAKPSQGLLRNVQTALIEAAIAQRDWIRASVAL
jgi:hypothetical protein